ncbi:MAG: FAD-dependent oxidoreductase [Planctomycetaceae bacterium]|nr:FAD-dependent oxidoreductase [Planctomycetaceae bacterium]
MDSSRKILIIGGVAGGASAAARLRRLDERAEIVLLERGNEISYANCGLPYYIGGEITEKSALLLQTPGAFRKRYNVDVRVGHEAVNINRAEKTVTVKNLQSGEEYAEPYDKLILSPGAEPIRPDGFESARVFTLRNVPDTFRIREFIDTRHPKNAVVVGGGYIGLEMAENLHRAGLDVTIVQRSDHVLSPLDFDMACDVHRHIESKGVRLLLDTDVQSVVEKDAQLHVTLRNGERLLADMMILSIGVRPDGDIAERAGLQVNKRGAIVVSENMLTSDADIYAVGDAVEITDFITKRKCFVPLAGPANKQGRIAADHLCGIGSKYTGTQGSAILRVFDMTVATTGLNERLAKEAGLDYEKSFTWSSSHAGYYPGAVNMAVKTLFEKTTGKILGVQITGYDGVDKRCDVMATAIRAGMSVLDLTRLELCYAPPYSSAKDPVNMAGFAAENILTGKVAPFHWHDIELLRQDKNAVFLDVRTKMEYGNGHIDGFINIPLDDLRGRLGEIDKNKRIYVTCQIGVRGYAATRILTQNGFNAYNLNGGYRLYHSIFGAKTPVATH